MKFSEATKPGGCAVNSDGVYGIWRAGTCTLSQFIDSFTNFNPDEVPGDDWTPVGPVVDLSDVPVMEARVSLLSGISNAYEYKRVYEADRIEGKALVTKPCSESERFALARQTYNECLDYVDEVFQTTSERECILPDFCSLGENKFVAVKRLALEYVKQAERIKELEAELAEARKAPVLDLSKALKAGDRLTKGHYLVERDGELHVYSERHGTTIGEANQAVYHPDPRPMPTLPEPEEVLEVPRWLNLQHCLGVVEDSDGDLGFILKIDPASDADLWGAWVRSEGTGFDQSVDCAIYRGPVRHLDGTVAPIEPSPELVEAVEGGK